MSTSKTKIVLDTNVLFAGLYSSKGASFKLLLAIEEERLKIVLSTALLFEYEEILKRNKKVLGLSIREVEGILNTLCLQSEHQKIFFLWRPRLPDPKDDHILELAIAADVKQIVTYNVKDFKGSDLFGINVLTPKKLMEKIQ